MKQRTKYLLAGGVFLLVLVGFATWFFVFRDTAPAEVSLEDALASETTTTTTGAASDSPAEDSTTTTTTTTPAGGLGGTWTVDTTRETFAGYRVKEELASIGAKTAVGRSPAVAGTLEFEGSAVASLDVTVDMTQLQSDSGGRDRAIEGQAIETDAFPTSTFVLTEPIELGSPPEEGVAFTAQAVGDLTIHGVTRSVTIPIEGQLDGGAVVVVGSIDVVFADYDIDTPRAAVVLSIEDQGVMEFQLFFTQ